MVEGTEQSALAVHLEIARGPNRRSSYIARENGVFGCELIEHAREILWMDGFLTGMPSGQIVQAFARRAIMLNRFLQMRFVWILRQLRQQRSKRALYVPNEAEVHLAAAADLFSAKVDLYDGYVLGIKRLIGKIRSQQYQYIAIHHREVAGRESEQARHPDVERIVVLDKFLATQGVHDRRLELAGKLD